jgi:hypothetical protein
VRCYCLTSKAINTGLGNCSDCVLTWDMVDWQRRILNIPRTKNEEPIYIPLNHAAVGGCASARATGDGVCASRSRLGTTSKWTVAVRRYFD